MAYVRQKNMGFSPLTSSSREVITLDAITHLQTAWTNFGNSRHQEQLMKGFVDRAVASSGIPQEPIVMPDWDSKSAISTRGILVYLNDAYFKSGPKKETLLRDSLSRLDYRTNQGKRFLMADPGYPPENLSDMADSLGFTFFGKEDPLEHIVASIDGAMKSEYAPPQGIIEYFIDKLGMEFKGWESVRSDGGKNTKKKWEDVKIERDSRFEVSYAIIEAPEHLIPWSDIANFHSICFRSDSTSPLQGKKSLVIPVSEQQARKHYLPISLYVLVTDEWGRKNIVPKINQARREHHLSKESMVVFSNNPATFDEAMHYVRKESTWGPYTPQIMAGVLHRAFPGFSLADINPMTVRNI